MIDFLWGLPAVGYWVGQIPQQAGPFMLQIREVKSLVDDTQLKGGEPEDVTRHLVSELIYLINTL